MDSRWTEVTHEESQLIDFLVDESARVMNQLADSLPDGRIQEMAEHIKSDGHPGDAANIMLRVMDYDEWSVLKRTQFEATDRLSVAGYRDFAVKSAAASGAAMVRLVQRILSCIEKDPNMGEEL